MPQPTMHPMTPNLISRGSRWARTPFVPVTDRVCRAKDRRSEPTEHHGKANPCHTTMLVAQMLNRIARFAGSSYGLYWARTSDPQLVDSGRAFAQVRCRSLRAHG